MITTNDIKTKETKPEKLKTITTDKVKPREFKLKGKQKPKDDTIITTTNVERFGKKRKAK